MEANKDETMSVAQSKYLHCVTLKNILKNLIFCKFYVLCLKRQNIFIIMKKKIIKYLLFCFTYLIFMSPFQFSSFWFR